MMFMDWKLCFVTVFITVTLSHVVVSGQDSVPFRQNYFLPFGASHVQVLDHDTLVQLNLDQFTGSVKFKSLQAYGSGWFSMKIKLPQKDSTGVITTFYLRSDNGIWDEVDFELLGGNGKELPYVIHTNLIINGQSGREQRFHVWFDPTADFHNYTLLWNSHQLVWFVDDKPLRVFKNNEGGSFPGQAVSIIGTIWNGTWASNNGAQVKWNEGPFVASYKGFGMNACPTKSSNDPTCMDSKYWWNAPKYWSLDSLQDKIYQDTRRQYMFFDYCSQPNNPYPQECPP